MMEAACRTWIEPTEVDIQLEKLRLKREKLQTAVQRSFFSWAACTANDPRIFPGIAGWAGGIRGMADELASDGWRLTDESGQPLVLNASGTIALTAATGDDNTGRQGPKQPRTSSGKGRKTQEGVISNAFLFAEMEQDAKAKLLKASKRSLWVLLMHRSVIEGKVYCELSRPIMMESKKGKRRIVGWSERIILQPVDFQGTPFAKPYEEIGPNAGQITVEIRRRS